MRRPVTDVSTVAAPTRSTAETEVPKPAATSAGETSPRIAHLPGSGVAIAWGAIAIGADIVGFWPRGFAFYAMLAGGGATMMLTAGLMAALFYSDTSGHDAAVHDFKPDQARRPPQRR
jgi:hypothetical protein